MKIAENNGKQIGHWRKKIITSVDSNDLRLIVHTSNYTYSNVADQNMVYVIL